MVGGDVIVVDGDVEGATTAAIGGSVVAFAGKRTERAADDDDIRVTLEWGEEDGQQAHDDASASFTVRFGTSYNRVEGLPIRFGPTLWLGGANPTRLEALAIVRTESDSPFDSDELGYDVRLEQFFGGHRAMRVGAGVHSTVRPIEDWKLSDLENSLSTLVFHDDRRDYFEGTGWRAYLRWTPPGLPLDATLGYRDEKYRLRAADDPWALFGDGTWRLQPLTAEGTLRSVVLRAGLDLRGDERDFASGLYVHARVERGFDGSLALPSWFVDDIQTSIPVAAEFTAAFLDLRRYIPIDDDSRVALRAVAGGSLTGSSLPPQFQHALGGIGTLPGYDLLTADCGARRAVVEPLGADAAFFPYYGCDRFAIVQVEYRGTLGIDIDVGTDEETEWRRIAGEGDDDWDIHLDIEPSWVLFFDAGRGWALDGSGVLRRSDTDTLYDAGLGLLFGDIGIYAALPLGGEADGINLFVRLGRRF